MFEAFPIVVFEKRPRWAPELRRQFRAEGTADANAGRSEVRIAACRSLADAESASGGRGVLVIDLSAAPGQTLEWLKHRTGRSPRLCVVAVATGKTFDLEWPVREAGVSAFVPESITGEEMAALCRRARDAGRSQ